MTLTPGRKNTSDRESTLVKLYTRWENSPPAALDLL
jgi:hypothetical protein